jgi:hypothetical protein
VVGLQQGAQGFGETNYVGIKTLCANRSVGVSRNAHDIYSADFARLIAERVKQGNDRLLVGDGHIHPTQLGLLGNERCELGDVGKVKVGINGSNPFAGKFLGEVTCRKAVSEGVAY